VYLISEKQNAFHSLISRITFTQFEIIESTVSIFNQWGKESVLLHVILNSEVTHETEDYIPLVGLSSSAS